MGTMPGGRQATKSLCHNPELVKAGTEQKQSNSKEETDSRNGRDRNDRSWHQFDAEEYGCGGRVACLKPPLGSLVASNQHRNEGQPTWG